MNFSFDYSDESSHDTLMRNPAPQACLSVLNSLGYSGDTQPRRISAKLAWISLQVRNCVGFLTMANSVKLPDVRHPERKISGFEDAGKSLVFDSLSH